MHYERQYNLLYVLEQNEQAAENKGIMRAISTSPKNFEISYRNILVYDIPKDLLMPIFKDGELKKDETVHLMLFERNIENGQLFCESNLNITPLNNFQIQRELNENLLIETRIGNKHKLWTSDKWGFEKHIIAEFDKDSYWHLDAFNAVLHLFSQDSSGKLLIKNLEW